MLSFVVLSRRHPVQLLLANVHISGCVPSGSESLVGFPCGKESPCKAGDLGLIPGLGRSPGEGKGYSFQYSGLENSMDM